MRKSVARPHCQAPPVARGSRTGQHDHWRPRFAVGPFQHRYLARPGNWAIEVSNVIHVLALSLLDTQDFAVVNTTPMPGRSRHILERGTANRTYRWFRRPLHNFVNSAKGRRSGGCRWRLVNCGQAIFHPHPNPLPVKGEGVMQRSSLVPRVPGCTAQV